MDPTNGLSAANPPPSRWMKWSVAVLLIYFGLRLLYYAGNISPYVPPDEVTHFGICKVFFAVFLLPENSANSYQFGLVTNIPWLYYWLMGKLLHLNLFGISDLLFLRVLNIPVAFGTVYFVRRLLRLLTADTLSELLVVIAMTNTMMFSFLSASVSYDNLTNLLAAMALCYLLEFFQKRDGSLLAVSLLCQLAGCLTKKTVLPLVLVLNVVLVVHELGGWRVWPGLLKEWFRSSGGRGAWLSLGILVCLALNIQLYGGNYYRYGSLDPEMFTVLPPEQAMQYRLAARSYIFERFKDGTISGRRALEMTAAIKHPGDRADTIELLENYQAFKENGSKVAGLPSYLGYWVERMAAGIFGIFGHLQIPNYLPTILPIVVLALLTALAFLLRWRPADASWLATMQAAVVAWYAFFLMYFVNYRVYLETGSMGLALQGRYLFPVIGPLYALASCYLLRLFNGKGKRLALLCVAAFIFILSDFPYFLAASSPAWFGRP